MQKGWRREGKGMREREREWTMVAERLEIRKEINSAIDKRPVKRQSAPVWVDEALSILDKKHNRRYPGDMEHARLLCLPFFSGSPAPFFLSYRKVESTFRNTRCNARDLFRFVSPFFLIRPTPGLPSFSLFPEGLRCNFTILPIETSGQELFPTA